MSKTKPKTEDEPIQKISPELAEVQEIIENTETGEEIELVNVSEKQVEKMARGFLLGTKSRGMQKDVRQKLEEKVTKRIGSKGKYLTDKLFELIEGVYIVDKRGGKDNRDVRYYQVPPNLQAITYALDRVLGKPTTRTETSEVKKGVVVIESIIKNLAGDTVVEVKEVKD